MSHTIPAIFENGIIRPLEEIELANGEEIEVILLTAQNHNSVKTRDLLREIAKLPIEGDAGEFSGDDHDEILYPDHRK